MRCRLHCAEPAALQLTPLVSQPKGLPPCPVSLESGAIIPAQNYLPLNIQIVVTDRHGRAFDNISSLPLEWSLSDHRLAKMDAELHMNPTCQ